MKLDLLLWIMYRLDESLSVGERDVERAKLVGHPAIGRLESEAGGVDQRHNREWSPCVWEVRAAGATVVCEFDADEVLIGNVATVASWLEACHSEQILLRNLNSCAFFLFVSRNFIADLTKVH